MSLSKSLRLWIHPLVLSLRFHRARLQGRAPIIVYQVGRVGSATVLRSLVASGVCRPVYHVHFMTPEGLALLEDVKRGQSDTEACHRTERYLMQSRFLARQIARGRARGEQYDVVTLVRDPIATNVSGFFHNLERWLPEWQNGTRIDSTFILKRFLGAYPHGTPLEWFDRELKPVFGVDVFSREFSASQGYQLYEGASARVLLVKLEHLERCAQRAFSAFLGLDHFDLVTANTAQDQPYAALYEAFLRDVVLPRSYVDRMLDARLVRHVYSAAEIDAFRVRWSRGQ